MKKWGKWVLATVVAVLIGIGLAWFACGRPVAAATRVEHRLAHNARFVAPTTRVPFATLPSQVQARLKKSR